MTTFAEMKNRRTDFSALADKLNPKSGAFDDDRFWYPQRNEAGNGYGIIRFLPETPDAKLFYVEVCRHGFKDTNGGFYHNCRTSLNKVDGYVNEQCPACQGNNAFFEQFGGYDTTPKAQRATRQKYYRKKQRISNIYVVSDPKNPENEGKIFLFKYGKQVQTKIDSAVKPEFDHLTPFDPFDMFSGADFEFKVTKVDGQTNNESSQFMTPGPLFPATDPEADAKAEAVWRGGYDITEFIADDQFASYDKQLEDWNRVTGGAQPIGERVAVSDTPAPVEAQPDGNVAAPEQSAATVAPVASAPVAAPTPENDASPDAPADDSPVVEAAPVSDTPPSVANFFENLNSK
jgi:hypothetical protein